MSDKRYALVYGTLRPGNAEEYVLEGYQMYDLGWFPGIRPASKDCSIVCERVPIVDDEHLQRLDYLEGYREGDDEGSFYIRQQVDLQDGNTTYIYVYNASLGEEHKVPSGDWLKHRNQERGTNASLTEWKTKEVVS